MKKIFISLSSTICFVMFLCLHTVYASTSLDIVKDSLGVTLTNNKTGYAWSSDGHFELDDSVNELWQNRIRSGITIEYYDPNSKRVTVGTVLESKLNPQVDMNMDSTGKNVISVNFAAIDISFDVLMYLEADALHVEIPFDSIRENGTMLLKSVTLFPFMGATRADEIAGYVVVPDGSGAIMDFDKPVRGVSNPFYARVFGVDEGLNDNFMTSYSLNMPIIGFVHGENENAMLVEILEGSAYADLYVYPSGVTTDFNWASFTFSYRQRFFQTTGASGEGFTDFEKDIVNMDVHVVYHLTEGDEANYTGLAKLYRQELEKRDILEKGNTNNTSVNISILAAEAQKKLFGFRTEVYTSLEDADEIVNDLISKSVNPNITVMSYYKNGRFGGLPNKTAFESKVGTEREWTEWVKKLSSNNIDVFFESPYALVNQAQRGFNKNRDLIRKIDQSLAVFSILYSPGNYEMNYGSLNYQAVSDIFQKDLKTFADNGMNISVKDIGVNLNSHYGDKKQNREEARVFVSEIFKQNAIKVAFNMPNSYIWEACSQYQNSPMTNSSYLHFSRSVPLLQSVLRGYIDLYSPYLNDSANPERDTLKLIEYGVYPSYVVTKESPKDLLGTPSESIFSSEYDLWADKIQQTYETVSSALDEVVGAAIEAHSFKDNIGITTYDNGKQIVINYSNKTFRYDGVDIMPDQFIVCEVK